MTQRVSREGCGAPRWSDDVKELYYVRMDNMLMVSRITAGAAGVTAGPRKGRFRATMVGYARYQLWKDRILMESEILTERHPLTLLLNRPALHE